MASTPFSRRRFLAIVAPTGAVLACSLGTGVGKSEPLVINVRDFGAKGDGVTDDAEALTRAVAAVKPGAVLRFPAGSYRFAARNPAGQAAISITGISGVRIEFDPGAELLMDNLDPGGAGTSHGIAIRGAATDISLRNVAVRWKTPPATRSFGDGIRIVGYPGDGGVPGGWNGSRGTVRGVSLTSCSVRSSPQAGVIMMGVSDITVTDLTVQDTMADGLHFNACRGARITGLTANNTGDDGLALVTYHTEGLTFDNGSETFSLPGLTDWSNTDFVVTGVRATGGDANGIRLAGAGSATISDVTVVGKTQGAGVILDSAAPGSDAQWFYVASRGVRLNQIMVDNCDAGIHVIARPVRPDDRFTRFDANVSGLTTRGCVHWSVLAESTTDDPVTGFGLDGGNLDASMSGDKVGALGLFSTAGMAWGNVTVTSGRPIVALSTERSRGLALNDIRITLSGASSEDPGPCAQFVSSDGTVNGLQISWPGAPQSWVPVQVGTGSNCVGSSGTSGSPVTITSLSVEPATVAGRVDVC